MTERFGASGGVVADAAHAPQPWLDATAHGLSALLGSDSAEARALFTEAAEHDATRTATFCLLVLALAGAGDRANMGWLDTAFPRLTADRPVTHAQRAVWAAAADGVYGEVGRALLRSRATSLIGRLSDERREAELPAWRAEVEVLPLPVAAPRLPDAATLSALRLWCGQATAVFDQPESDPQPTPQTADLVTAVLASLLADGDPGRRLDAELIDGLVGELRAVDTASPHWEASTGNALALLRVDAFDSEQPGRRTIAVRAGTWWLTTIGAELAEASEVKPPQQIVTEIAGRPTRLHARRALHRQLARVEERIDAGVAPRYRERNLAIGVFALGVLVTLIGLSAPVALIIGAVIMGFGGGWTIGAEQNRRYVVTNLAERKRQAAQDAQQALDDLAERRVELAETREQATRDLAAVQTALTR